MRTRMTTHVNKGFWMMSRTGVRIPQSPPKYLKSLRKMLNEHKQILDLIDRHDAEEIESCDFTLMLLEFPREAVEEVKDWIPVDIYEGYLMERWRLFKGYIGFHWSLPISVDKEDIALKSFGLRRYK